MNVLFHFPGGGAYTLGRHNHGDCWYLFTIDNITDGLQIPDQTLEVSFFYNKIIETFSDQNFFNERAFDYQSVAFDVLKINGKSKVYMLYTKRSINKRGR